MRICVTFIANDQKVWLLCVIYFFLVFKRRMSSKIIIIQKLILMSKYWWIFLLDVKHQTSPAVSCVSRMLIIDVLQGSWVCSFERMSNSLGCFPRSALSAWTPHGRSSPTSCLGSSALRWTSSTPPTLCSPAPPSNRWVSATVQPGSPSTHHSICRALYSVGIVNIERVCMCVCLPCSDRPPLPPLCHSATGDCLHWKLDALEEALAVWLQGLCVSFS